MLAVLGSHAAVQLQAGNGEQEVVVKVNIKTLQLSQAAATKSSAEREELKPPPANQLEAVVTDTIP